MRGSSLLVVGLIAAVAQPGIVRAQTSSSVHVQVEIPTGWFGVRISDQAVLNESGAAFFDRYPVVSSVEPGSPAAKAGVRPGDVLMSFDSHDMRGSAFELKNWLKPGAPFELRLRRNDAVRVVRGVLGRRPDGWEEMTIVQISPSEQMMMRRNSQADGGRMEPTAITLRTRRSPARLPSVLVPALGFGGGVYPFAGAEFTALNDDLSEVLGVKTDGVFVTNVAEGSLARNSGLRGGDVVVTADSITITNPNDLVRAIRNASDQSVTLQVIRKRKAQTLTLRW